MYVGLFMYFAWMLVKGMAVMRAWIYFKFDCKQRYIFNRHSSLVLTLYGKLLIKTDASCTCLIIICHLIWFAGHRGKYVSCLNYRITMCLSFCCIIFIMLIVPFFKFPDVLANSVPIFVSLRQDTAKKAWSHNPIFMSWLTFPYTAPLFCPPV